MSGIAGDVFPALEERMHFRVARQAALAGNLANTDTPGYRRVDLKFEEALQAAISQPRRTHPRHLSASGGAGEASYRVEIGPRGTRPDGNGVDLDSELIEASRNAGAFKDFAAVLARIVTIRRLAVTGK